MGEQRNALNAMLKACRHARDVLHGSKHALLFWGAHGLGALHFYLLSLGPSTMRRRGDGAAGTLSGNLPCSFSSGL